MGRYSSEIAELVASYEGRSLDARYLAFFECFNRGLFFEAHDVLEEFWLPQRDGPNGLFFKGLIQLAGAFVHLQKNRLGPAAALLQLARANLDRYGLYFQCLQVRQTIALIEDWAERIRSGALPDKICPELTLEGHE